MAFGLPPWLQGMQGGGMGQPGASPMMTPGAGMPPSQGQGAMPFPLQRPQMGPPGQVPPMPPGGGGQPQQPINPAQMGMLSQMLAQNTRGAAPMPGAMPSAPGTLPGAAAMPAPGGPPGGPPGAAAQMDPNQMGMLAPWLRMALGPFGG